MMTRYYLSLLFLGLLIVPGFSQTVDDWDDDIQDIEIIDSTTTTTPSTLNYWDEHLSGVIAGGYTVGANHYRILSNVSLMYKEKWHNLNVVLQGAYYNFKIESDATLHTYTESPVIDSQGNYQYTNYDYTETDIKDIISDSQLKLRQAYIEFSPIKGLNLAIGRQTTVWGQLDLISPIDILLPMGYNPTGFSLSKIDMRMPQTTIKAAYYPNNNIELTSYLFPFYEEGELFSGINFSDSYLDDRTSPPNATTGEYERIYLKKDIPNQSSYALRGMWYHDRFTTGVTYYKGFFNLLPWVSKRFVNDAFRTDLGPQGPSTYRASFREHLSYFPIDAFGFELAIPMGQTSFKFESSIFNLVDNLAVETNSENNAGTKELVDFINTRNGGSTLVNSKYLATFVAGLDADFDHWFYNFYITTVQILKNPSAEGLISDYNNLNGVDDIMTDGAAYFPTFNIGRYFNEEKKGAYGIALGFLTGSLGAVGYVGNQISESWSWNLSLEVLGAFNDFGTMLRNLKGDGQSYIEPRYVEPKVAFGLNYTI